jgi:hypothetical protein
MPITVVDIPIETDAQTESEPVSEWMEIAYASIQPGQFFQFPEGPWQGVWFQCFDWQPTLDPLCKSAMRARRYDEATNDPAESLETFTDPFERALILAEQLVEQNEQLLSIDDTPMDDLIPATLTNADVTEQYSGDKSAYVGEGDDMDKRESGESDGWFVLGTYLTFESLHECSIDCCIIGEVTMLRDFGPFKAGETLEFLTFDFVNGSCIQHKNGTGPDAGEIIRACKFGITAEPMGIS